MRALPVNRRARATEVGDHTVGTDHDAAHVADEGGGDGVGRIDRCAVRGAAPATGRLVDIEPDGLIGHHGAQLCFEHRLVDDDVHHRQRRTAAVGDGGVEDRGQRIGAALVFAAGRRAGAGIVAEPGPHVGPVGSELGPHERLEHLGDLGALGGAEAGAEVEGCRGPR